MKLSWNHLPGPVSEGMCQVMIPSRGIFINRPYSYSLPWTGTNMQWRLMQGWKDFPASASPSCSFPVQPWEYEYSLSLKCQPSPRPNPPKGQVGLQPNMAYSVKWPFATPNNLSQHITARTKPPLLLVECDIDFTVQSCCYSTLPFSSASNDLQLLFLSGLGAFFSVVSCVVSFSNHRPRLESYRVSHFTTSSVNSYFFLCFSEQ